MMTPDRRNASELRDRLDKIQHGYEKWVAYTIRLLAILVAIQLGLGALSLYLVGQNRKRTDEIQASRELSTRTACRDQNARHDNTIKTLNQLVAQRKATASPAQRKQLADSLKPTILLIDALTPRRDCEKVVARLIALPSAGKR